MNISRAWTILLTAVSVVSVCDCLSLPSRVPAKSLSSSPLPSLSRPPRPPLFSSSTALLQSVEGGDGDASSSTYEKLDTEALIKYPLGLAAQTALMFGFLTAIDKMLAYFSPPLMKPLPFVVNFVFLYAFNLKSSLFSILPNKKSDGRKLNQENWEYNKRNVPSWTPPGIAFVFGWPLFTFGLRAFTGAMIVQSTGGRFASPAIMSLMLHFCMGNLWNTANNVERRLGLSVILLYGLWLTKAFCAWQFYKVNPMAGKLLALTLIWITAACALETRTWQINPDPETGKLEPLLPRKHPKWATKFRWEQL